MTHYLVTPKGFFEEYNDELFSGRIKSETPIPFTKGMDTMEIVEEELEEKVELKFNRMPLSLFQEVLAFLEWCYKEHKSEGMVCHRYIDGKWENVVFHQWVSGGSVCYHPELNLNKATRIMGDTHSHPPSYGSGHSHTDGLDERKNNGIFIVVKGFTPMDCTPEIIGCVRGKRFHLKPESVFDISEYNPNPTFPEEWKELVGSLPCKGCERRREQDRIGKEVSEKVLAFEDDKKFRIIPQAVLALWRSEIAKEIPTLGKAVAQVVKDIKTRANAYNLHWFRCDNYGCKKSVKDGLCPDCKKSVYIDRMIEAFIDMLDEHEAITKFPQEVAMLMELVEAELVPKPLPPIKMKDTPAAPNTPAVQPSTGTSASSTSPTNSGPSQTSTVGSHVVRSTGAAHILLVATEKPCSVECTYKDYPHEHVKEREDLKKAFGQIINGTQKHECGNSEKKCLYPNEKACENGCVWNRTGLGGKAVIELPSTTPADAKKPEDTVDKHLPTCSSAACIKENHKSFYSCDIKKALDITAKMCPSKDCEKSGHTWHGCDVRHLMIKLIACGRLRPPSQDEVKKDDTTRRFPVPTQIPGACTQKDCQDSDHKDPGVYDCPVYRQRKAAAEAPVAHSYPPEDEDTVIVGDSSVCPGEACSHFKRPHKHELGTLPVPAKGADADKVVNPMDAQTDWEHDMGGS